MEIDDLQETAGMARLCLNEQELQQALAAINEIVNYLDIMHSYSGNETNDTAVPCRCVDSSHFSAGNSGIDTNITAAADTVKEMLERVPEKDGSFIVIPNVL